MLDALVRYALDHNLVAEPGFKPKKVRWNIVFDQEGNFLDVHGFGDEKNPGKEFPKCPDLSLPEIRHGGKGCRHFLADSIEVVVLFGANTNDPKITDKHAYFLGLLRKAAPAVPQLSLIAEQIETPEKLEAMCSSFREKKANKNDIVSFSILGRTPPMIVDDSSWHEWWREFRKTLAQSPKPLKRGRKQATAPIFMRCFASGNLVTPFLTHYKISGLAGVGGQPAGDALVSFKQDSFRSYGLKQSENAAVSEEMVANYRAALDNLISRTGHNMAGVKIVHWYSGRGSVSLEFDPLDELAFLDEMGNDAQVALDARVRAERLLKAIRNGERPDMLDYRYFILTLSGASGRIMVRDFIEGPFEKLLESINDWFNSLEIAQDRFKTVSLFGIERIITSLLSEKKPQQKYEDWIKPIGSEREALWKSAINRECTIPVSAIRKVVLHHRQYVVSGKMDEKGGIKRLLITRMALLKAYHVRKGDKHMRPYLNEEHPHPAYHCGRLIAVLADLQYAAQGDVGAGIIQRYYAAASSTPALVLGRLIRLSQFHLTKLDVGLAHWYENRIASIWGAVKDNVPSVLTLEEQSLFALGYYQQKAQKKSIDKPARESN